jgi:serine/threonine protein phosphatase PrpC
LASQKAVEDVAQNVVRSAMNRGATDNVTAIVARLAR